MACAPAVVSGGRSLRGLLVEGRRPVGVPALVRARRGHRAGGGLIAGFGHRLTAGRGAVAGLPEADRPVHVDAARVGDGIGHLRPALLVDVLRVDAFRPHRPGSLLLVLRAHGFAPKVVSPASGSAYPGGARAELARRHAARPGRPPDTRASLFSEALYRWAGSAAPPGPALNEDPIVDQEAADDVAADDGLLAAEARLLHELLDGGVHGRAALGRDGRLAVLGGAQEPFGELARRLPGVVAEVGQQGQPVRLVLLRQLVEVGAGHPPLDSGVVPDVGSGHYSGRPK